MAATGRLSSSDPNLQNIPVRSEQGRQIRQAFLPAEGWLLLTADYSQIELRLLAHFCGDAVLRQAFAEDRDIHAAVAAQIYGLPEGEVTPDLRRVAKTVNFGVLYGMSAHGLAQRLGMPREEAASFIDAYFARYPKVLDYQQRLLASVRKSGEVGTLLGRKRRLDPAAINPHSHYRNRAQAERIFSQEIDVPTSSQPLPVPHCLTPHQAAAYVDLCHALMNSTEFLFVD